MSKGRLEAFSDGVFAVLITIMVLELKVPHGDGLSALRPLIPVFLTYVLSFLFLGIYWNNHHHTQPAPSLLAVPCALRHRMDGGRTTSPRCPPPSTVSCS